MTPSSLSIMGFFGALVAAACCFTPALTLLLVAAGLSALVGWIDYVALPALAIFLGIMLYGALRYWRTEERTGPGTARCCPTGGEKSGRKL